VEDQSCIICGQSGTLRMVLRDKVICRDCEQRIVSAAVGDENYEDLRIGLMKLWEGVPLREG